MTRHRFINDGRSPIPMGATAEFACVCGRRGSRAAIEQHIAESTDGIVVNDSRPDGDFDSGGTKAHYLPVDPRPPAPPSSFSDADAITPAELPPPPAPTGAKQPRSIAELFQDMLRSAYQAGAASAATGEPFEMWYQREVLQ